MTYFVYTNLFQMPPLNKRKVETPDQIDTHNGLWQGMSGTSAVSSSGFLIYAKHIKKMDEIRKIGKIAEKIINYN